MSTSNIRKRNRYILIAIVLLLVAGFVGLLMRSPDTDNAYAALLKCRTTEEVKRVWNAYGGQQLNGHEFENKTREKLTTFNLSSNEINACLEWLPPTPTHKNLIVIPDLSNRISDTANYPNQFDADITIMHTIWKAFLEVVGTRESKDQMAVVITDELNMNGPLTDQFSNLFINMAEETNNPDHLFFTPYRTTKYNRNCREIYEYALENVISSDFYTFFKSDIESFLKHPTLYDNYTNKLIIITDGRIEENTGGGTTEIEKFSQKMMTAYSKDSLQACITNQGLNLRPVQTDWTNTDLLICEINGGKKQPKFHTEVIIAYWEDWFNKMGCSIETIKSGRPEPMVASQIKTFILN